MPTERRGCKRTLQTPIFPGCVCVSHFRTWLWLETSPCRERTSRPPGFLFSLKHAFVVSSHFPTDAALEVSPPEPFIALPTARCSGAPPGAARGTRAPPASRGQAPSCGPRRLQRRGARGGSTNSCNSSSPSPSSSPVSGKPRAADPLSPAGPRPRLRCPGKAGGDRGSPAGGDSRRGGAGPGWLPARPRAAPQAR